MPPPVVVAPSPADWQRMSWHARRRFAHRVHIASPHPEPVDEPVNQAQTRSRKSLQRNTVARRVRVRKDWNGMWTMTDGYSTAHASSAAVLWSLIAKLTRTETA